MIHDLHAADNSRKRVVATLVQMIREVGIIPLAECVESEAEAQACAEAGFVLSQGYLHGKPLPAAHYIELARAERSKRIPSDTDSMSIVDPAPLNSPLYSSCRSEA